MWQEVINENLSERFNYYLISFLHTSRLITDRGARRGAKETQIQKP